MNVSVGDAVKVLRISRGLSARQLSNLAGLSPSYVSKLEAGEIVPSFQAFASLAVVLEMTRPEIMMLLRCAATNKAQL
jgi:transcriptional regulator with XRE-family HTH domain